MPPAPRKSTAQKTTAKKSAAKKTTTRKAPAKNSTFAVLPLECRPSLVPGRGLGGAGWGGLIPMVAAGGSAACLRDWCD